MTTLMKPFSREQALEAVRQFHAQHGRLPRWREWERATGMAPCAKTIERRWGWRELLAEAIGVKPNQIDVSWEAVLDDRAQAMLAALKAARDELGRWPLVADWETAGLRPSPRTFTRHFGSWRRRVGRLTGHLTTRPETGDPPRPHTLGPCPALSDASGRPGPSHDVDAEVAPNPCALAVDFFRRLKDTVKVPHEVGLSLGGHHDERHVGLSERIAKLTSFATYQLCNVLHVREDTLDLQHRVAIKLREAELQRVFSRHGLEQPEGAKVFRRVTGCRRHMEDRHETENVGERYAVGQSYTRLHQT